MSQLASEDACEVAHPTAEDADEAAPDPADTNPQAVHQPAGFVQVQRCEGVAVTPRPRQHPPPRRAVGGNPVDRYRLVTPDDVASGPHQLPTEEGVLATTEAEVVVESHPEPANLAQVEEEVSGCRDLHGAAGGHPPPGEE